MSAGSPGMDWTVNIKPLLVATHSTFNKDDIPEFVTSLINSEKEILQHEEQFEQFYCSFVALSAHFLSLNAGVIPQSSFQDVITACRILLKFILDRLQNNSEGCIISVKCMVLIVKGLCKGTGSLSKADVVTFISMLRSSKTPSYIRDVEPEPEVIQPKDANRPRLDTGSDIFSKLTSVFEEVSVAKTTKVDISIDSIAVTLNQSTDSPSDELRNLFSKRNLQNLAALDGSNIIIDVCCGLSFLARYTQNCKDALIENTFNLPCTLSEALTTRNSYQALLNDISVVWRAFSLPIFEPLTPKRLEKVAMVTLSCLYASVTVALCNTIINMTSTAPTKPSSPKDEEIDNYGSNIVQKTLEIFLKVSDAVRSSSRAGGNMAQNLNLMSSLILLRGLQNILALTPSAILERKETKTKSQDGGSQKPSRPSSAKSAFQGFGVLSVALATKALELVQQLLDDLEVEGLMPDMGVPIQSKQAIQAQIITSQSAAKRVRKLISIVNLPDLMFSLITTSFRKAALLKRLKQGSDSSETSSSSTSDSNTFYEDDFSSSDDSSDEEEEDTEPLLGQALMEALSPYDHTETTPTPPAVPSRVEGTTEIKRGGRKLSSGDSPHFVPDKREPEAFANMAGEVLNFLTVYFVTSNDTELQKLLRTSLNEEHMHNLSVVIKDLDKECNKSASDKVYGELSQALAKFNHNLIATRCLNESLQDVLLGNLGISPNSVDPWPLTVHSRTLAVLAEVILLKQQRERETKLLKSQSEAAIISIWVRFMTTLKSTIQNYPTKADTYDDVNVEHLQLLMFLFHSLPLIQKRSLILQLAQNIVSISELETSVVEDLIPLPLSRLFLVFEYLLHYFYDPPAELIEQVKWNLFTVHTLSHSDQEACGSVVGAPRYFECKEVEEQFSKNISAEEATEVGTQKPRFYNLGPVDTSGQDAPKVDGLACSFLLSNADSLNYNLLYDACVILLMAGFKCDKNREKLSLLESSSMHYNFMIVWRLLSCLPPSVQYVRLLEGGTLQMSNAHVLHTLRWAPRIGQKVYTNFVKDCLVKQGLTTQQAESLMSAANKTSNNFNYDIRLAMNFIQDQIAVLPLVGHKEIIQISELPGIYSILLLDSVIAKIQVALDEAFSTAIDGNLTPTSPKSGETDFHKAIDVAQDLIPATLLLLEAYSVYVRSCILGQLKHLDDNDPPITSDQLEAFGTVMSVGSSRVSKVFVQGSEIMSTLPRPITVAIDKWMNSSKGDIQVGSSWKTSFGNDLIPAESYIDSLLNSHISTLSVESPFTVNASLKHVLESLVKFASDLVGWCENDSSSKEMVRVMFPMIFDASTTNVANKVAQGLEKVLGPIEGDQFLEKTYHYCISVCQELVLNFSSKDIGLDEKVLLECLKFIENHVEKAPEKKAFQKFYSEGGDLMSLILSPAKGHLSLQYSNRILRLLNKLLQLSDKNGSDKTYEVVNTTLSKLAEEETMILQTWLSKMVLPSEEEDDEATLRENRMLLRNTAKYLVKDKSPVGEKVSLAILQALIPMGERLLSTHNKDKSGFPELMMVMHTLAGAGQGTGHCIEFQAAIGWLDLCKSYLTEKEVKELITDTNSNKGLLDTLCCLLLYIGEILAALKRSSDKSGVTSPPVENEVPVAQEGDGDEWGEDLAQDDEDSAAEDSDEESLNNKLCTFTMTQKEFMNQHWYHCHTCKMVDGVGVCTVCAKVCHKDHDLTYAKFGSFFCDCGAKDDGSCKALVKRSADSGLDNSDNISGTSPFSMESMLPSSLRRRMSSPGPAEKSTDTNKMLEQVNKARESLSKQLEGSKEVLVMYLESFDTVKTVLEMLETILPTLTENYQKVSPIGSTQRAQKALYDLHNLPKSTENTDQLMTVTLGSQEGAFENVRMNYSGDQGQQIRQLITAHMLRRVAMCVLASPHGKRQHLAVSHEKGKITILQLSALLKQADSSKKKLTLTRLASAPIPFTVMSITGNPCNEDYLAVCGLKDCHILTFTSSGSVADHLVLHPTLPTGNFIIKAVWLPGTQTELAIVTADFVKIYDLGTDALSPQFFFLLPSGKIRDATFICTEEGRYMVLMASSGYIYTQLMDEGSSAKHGPFYITNVLEVKHPELKDVNGQVSGGGVSVYYSHALQLLFFSYTQGRSFASTVHKDLSQTPLLFPITLKSNNGSSKGGNNSQPLVQWSEVPGHTGLMYCMTQSTSNPVILMIKPDAILVQEIKVVPAKAKIQDVVAIRHAASNSDQQQRTTMILLCEDGSLRIYMANVDTTNYWLSPYLQPQSPIAVLKPVKKKKTTRLGRPVGSVSFPCDFFEHCTHTVDVEFGGNDILQVYNIPQIKHRLNTTGMYIASTKPAGFTIEISNTNNLNVMVGLRVLVGTQSIERAPSYLEIFGRTTQVNLNRARWFDLPLTREESLTADKKFTLFIGASVDPAGVTMVDSIKVYTKTKEAFGWPEEADEFQEAAAPKTQSTNSNVPTATTATVITTSNTETAEVQPSEPLPLTSADRLLGSALEVLDGAFAIVSVDEKDPTWQKALNTATSLLTLPTPPTVQQHTRALLASLFPTRAVYHNHKDQAELAHVMQTLSKENKDMDVEAYQRLLVTARSVAVSRSNNLIKFAEKQSPSGEEVLEVTDLETEKEDKQLPQLLASLTELDSKEKSHFVTQLTEAFWKLHISKPANAMLAPVCLPGLAHVDATVAALVEIIHAFTLNDFENIDLATKLYLKLLLCPDQTVSFACKMAVIKCLRPRHRRRRVFIPSPPRCSSPGAAVDDIDDDDDDDDDDEDKENKEEVAQPIPEPQAEDHEPEDIEADPEEQFEVVEQQEPMVLEPLDPPEQGMGGPIPIEALLAGGVNFPPMVDIPPDADDETMVELAIALSLQDQPGHGGSVPGALGLQGLGQQSLSSLEEGPLSDTTASAPGSDDEIGSTAATDGSTLRTSPAEPAGSAGSDSGGSAMGSVSGDHSVSGRSSTYGDRDGERGTTGPRSETSSFGIPSGSMPHYVEGPETDAEYITSRKLHNLRLMLLERLLQYLPEIRNVGGVRAIPFMQVLLMLTSDLDSEEEKDKAALDNLLMTLVKALDLSNAKELETVACRSKSFEVKLVLLRLLSVLLSRTKSGTKSSEASSSFISNQTASALINSDAIPYCLTVLKNLLPYWKQFSSQEDEGSSVTGQLLKPHPQSPPPQMSPFFLRQYVKGHASDVFEDYPQLLTEMVLRLPYQLKKISDSVTSVPTAVFDNVWNTVLSEYMMTQQTPFVKRHVRKLLLFICGSKDKYRQLRDIHAIESHLKAVTELCREGGLDISDMTPTFSIILSYDTLLNIIEHLKVCSEIATSRPINWQLYCKDHENVLSFLVRSSIVLDEGVSPTLLQLLQLALCGSTGGSGGSKPQPQASDSSGSTNSPGKQKKDKDKDKDKNEDSDDGQKYDETLSINLVQLLTKILDRSLMIKFIQTFLLESNATSIRWQAHNLVYNIYKNSSLTEQENLLELMWSLWKELPLYGRKASQFVDLLGYFVLKTPQTSEKKTKEYLEKAISVLKEENQILSNHPNAQIYNMLQGLVDFDGYYLESDPCLVCNNPEVPYSNLKLSAIKVDSKFTTTTVIIKLVGSHTISKISLRISDLKRTKMVRVMNIYYNNRSVQAVVELKNRPGLWHKARKVTLTAGQTDVRVEFPIPIVACNLMIEYADFYDNLQATAETLQCPRCSASVPANPGVCGNCGENVFQCHKCRAINYDEKDPFLCNACGFCKYAKFDFILTAKPCCAVDPIENEDDRKKAIVTINNLLEKADRIYKQLQQHRPVLEKLLIQVTEHSAERLDDINGHVGATGGVPGSSVNKSIQQLALKYCNECKSSFDELSKVIQKVLACRKELVEYDCQQRETVAAASRVSPVTSPRDQDGSKTKAKELPPCSKPRAGKDIVKPTNCYGCASAAVEHCITLLRALVTNTNLRHILCSQGMIKELIDYNLRHGTLNVRTEVRSLLCLLTKDNRRGTEEMNNLIMTRIAASLRGHLCNPDLGSSVRHEIMLLATSLQQDDCCWEQRLKCVMRLFLMGMQMKHPVIMDSITLPCLRILQHQVKSDQPVPVLKKDKPLPLEGSQQTGRNPTGDLHISNKKWLQGDQKHSFQAFKKRQPKKVAPETAASASDRADQPVDKAFPTPDNIPTPPDKMARDKSATKAVQQENKPQGEQNVPQDEKVKKDKKEVRAYFLMEKYVGKWQKKMWKTPAIELNFTQTTWLQQAMFSPSSRSARQTACSIIESIAQIPSRRKEIIDMLIGYLDDISKSGECATEYLLVLKRLIQPEHWKYYLAIKGVLLHLGDLITQEVEQLEYLEETTLSSDLAQGFALKSITELLSQFVEQEVIKRNYKNKLVGYVLNGYLSLRKLVVQRTKLIDDTQDKLLELLEELTTGTESETKEFMQVCVQTVKKYPSDDYRSPVFIFERLCSIIFPEENDVGEFLLILEKDPQQEDFLQGRMLGNPYSSNEQGLGPLMRDIKNKICQDCELVALLEDDTGMELLVNKKIISLDLPVKEVYKKIWAPEHGEGEPMPIIYRMRGLLGDATEDMVNSLDTQREEDIDKEEVYKMAAVLGEGDGLKVMLQRLSSVRDLVLGKQMMTVLLKLFEFAVNVKSNRLELLKPEMDTINVMLGALNLALWAEQESGASTKGQTITEQILQIMEIILLEASHQPPEKYREFSELCCGDKDQFMLLLERINSPFVRANTSVLQGLMRLIPFLAFGEEDKMEVLVNNFKPYLDFNKFDIEHSQDEMVHLDCFCVIASGIENNANGTKLKDMILEHDIVKSAVDYILQNSPEVKTLLPTDTDMWKDFLSKPSLSYALRLLTGLSSGHAPTQLIVGSECIPILHKLEQASSDKYIGTMAENLLEVLRENEQVVAKIEEFRQQTKSEKKRLAMAKRKKQLGALGMMTNEKGQVTVKSSVLKQMEDLKEETGLTCCICREGYRYQPQKVLACYTFTKRANVDDFENKPRKSVGYSTVSHFNVIHVDCHTAAVRHARGREEWESAALQNANTKCNGLLPFWGPQVQESAFATCLARHNTYLQECTGVREPSYPYNVHDLKLLIMKFANEKSFSEDSGGGGRQSNIHVMPYIMHMALYVINTTRSVAREEKNLNNFLDLPKDKWVENSFETEGALYWTAMALHILPPDKWKEKRVRFLERILVLAHARQVCPMGSKTLSDKKMKEFSTYRCYLIFFGIVNAVFQKVFRKITVTSDNPWSSTLADHIRNNDKPNLEAFDRVLSAYEEEMLPSESITEFFDAIELLEDVTEPEKFITDLLASLP